MKDAKHIAIIVLISLVLISGVLAIIQPTYEKSRIKSEQITDDGQWHGCTEYYAQCRCAGIIYADQEKTSCAGIELCTSINKTLCGGA